MKAALANVKQWKKDWADTPASEGFKNARA